ncbi:MAG: GNAT family N-acetyltransferase [Clostridia bacterium]|nr:GNAT family N-acetyltransferase [Clostridia bacterium]
MAFFRTGECRQKAGKRLKLIEPTIQYDRQIQAFRKEFLDAEGSMDGCGSLKRFETTQEWLDQVQALRSIETTPPELVPMTQFICVREEDEKIVGVIQIRHFLNDYLRQYAGHIGYSVCPSERRKGYASEMLRKALPVCRDLGIYDVMISCVEGNVGSRRTILKNGGIFDSRVFEPDRQIWLERYWIHISRE